MKLKKGVRLLGIKPELIVALLVVDSVYNKHGSDAVITSIIDSKHSMGSLHYAGCAFDVRTSNINNPQIIAREIQEALGEDFDVIFDVNHIHVEFQPKRAYT